VVSVRWGGPKFRLVISGPKFPNEILGLKINSPWRACQILFGACFTRVHNCVRIVHLYTLPINGCMEASSMYACTCGSTTTTRDENILNMAIPCTSFHALGQDLTHDKSGDNTYCRVGADSLWKRIVKDLQSCSSKVTTNHAQIKIA
jgi:hypothetical protein